MSEAIAEMVLPGTYIEVRAEGLISVGSISTGNVGIVGTAARGARNEVVAIGSYGEAIERFGRYDSFASPTVANHPLSLTRTLQRAFAGGASNVYAVRIANGDPVAASADVKTASDADAFTMTAKSPGTYGNAIAYSLTKVATTWTLKLELDGVKEEFEGTNVGTVHAALATSTLIDVGTVSNAANQLKPVDPAEKLAGGDDKPNVSSTDVEAGLAKLLDQPINIVLVGGFGSAVVRGAVGAHLEAAENDGKERIAVLGATDSTQATVETELGALNDDRIVLVAPGMIASDAATGQNATLPPSYMAATVAGKLSTLAPHISLTNKTLAVNQLDTEYSTTVYKKLLQARALLVRRRFGFQVVKGISTDTGPFKQISVRRIVDYAKAGVRLGSNPYIGRLNNARVRGALKATLDGFLSQMVVDEMLTEYLLDVSATRAEEIAGIARVTMTLKPTFSIDFIRVTMNLE